MDVDGVPTYRILAVDGDRDVLDLFRDTLLHTIEEPSTLEALFARPPGTFSLHDPAHESGPSFDVSLVDDATEATRMVRQALATGRPYAAAFIDVCMGDRFEGVWAAERIRAMDPSIELVMFSSGQDVSLRELNRRIQPPQKLLYMEKPFRPREIRQLAASLCFKWETDNRLRELNETLAQKVAARTRELNEANARLRRDIERRAEVLQELQASEERYRQLFEEDITGNFVAGPRGNILDCNESFTRIFGFETKSRARSFNVQELEFTAGIGRNLLDAVRRLGKVDGLETVWRGGKGRDILLVGTFDGVFDENGTLREIRGYIFDITERRRLEEQLRLAQKMEALGTLAGGIAHDFNNILGVIMGYAEIIQNGAEKGSGLARRVGEIISAGSRARDLVNQILNFSRQGPQERQTIHVSTLLKEALRLLRSSIPATVTIETDVSATDDKVMADATQLHQILLNLCTNAAQAMGERPGTLRVTLTDADADGDVPFPDTLGEPRFFLRLSVRDTGPGMPPEVMERIFDPFFTTKRPGEGTGMGLAMVHGIVKNHGGVVTVRSAPGAGSEFHVFLPRTEEPVRRHDEAPPLLAPLQGRVLFVDDEKPLGDVGREMLENFGFEVVVRTSSIEALEAFRFRPDAFDLLITDQTMPNMTGMELAREVLHIRPDMPIILCTGFSEAVSYERVKSLGIGDFIMKPILKHELIESIGRLLCPPGNRPALGRQLDSME